MPAASGSAPAPWMGLAGLLVDMGSLPADCCGGSAVALMGRVEFDAAVAVPVVVPIHKCRHPLAGLFFAREWPVRIVWPVFDRAEKGFRVGVVVGVPWPGKGSQHPHLLQP